jgi:integrase/recombinase XerD
MDGRNDTGGTMSTEQEAIDQVAEAFDRNTDPLKEYESAFEGLDVDPLEAYIDRVLIPNGSSGSTLDNYRYSYDQWRAVMDELGRHPACPSDRHVKQFVISLRDEHGNVGSTINKKLNNVNRAYEWWQEHHAFPHPTDYNPFKIAKREIDLSGDSNVGDYPPLNVSELRDIIQNCLHVRDRLFIVWPLKFALRAGALLNIHLEDIALSHGSIKHEYPSLGTAAALDGYENVLYIPSRDEREGNKSHRSRILPLDDEARRVLIQFLQTRPTVDSPNLIVSERTYEPMDDSEHVSVVWKDHFEGVNNSAEYEKYRNIRSHYGRNFFTNYWKIQEDIPRELVQYMRGDKLGKSTSGEAIDEYLEAHYGDIRDLYLDRVFKLL